MFKGLFKRKLRCYHYYAEVYEDGELHGVVDGLERIDHTTSIETLILDIKHKTQLDAGLSSCHVVITSLSRVD